MKEIRVVETTIHLETGKHEADHQYIVETALLQGEVALEGRNTHPDQIANVTTRQVRADHHHEDHLCRLGDHHDSSRVAGILHQVLAILRVNRRLHALLSVDEQGVRPHQIGAIVGLMIEEITVDQGAERDTIERCGLRVDVVTLHEEARLHDPQVVLQ